MRYTSLVFTLLLTRAASAELTIFDVRRNLPLSDSEKVYHDYLVDSGVEAGLKLGMRLDVFRRAPIYDYYRFRAVADLKLIVAKVKVIAVQEGISVVRLTEELPRETNPILDDGFIMVGDKLDLATIVANNQPTPPPSADVAVAPTIGPVLPQIVVNSVELTLPPAVAPAPKAAGPGRAPAAVAAPK